MKLSKEFLTWLAWRGGLIFFIAIMMLGSYQQQPQPPSITRTLGTSTQPFEVLWSRQDIPALITTDMEGTAYATRLFGKNSLIAFDAKSGFTKWKIDLPFELGGADGIFADQNKVFVVSGSYVNAYEKTAGKLKWSLKLGEGHVTVISQLDANMLRFYYGDTIIEIDPEIGKIVASIPKGDIIWKIGNLELHAPFDNQLFAFDGRSSQRLWNLDRSFFVTWEWKPEESEEGVLIIGYQALWSDSLVREICALNLQTGKNNWCQTENYISNMAVDQQSQLGYVLRADFVLERIDLKTGNILGEIRFLPSALSKEMLQHSQSYFVALSNDIVIVSFSDSGQTFGLKFSQ